MPLTLVLNNTYNLNTYSPVIFGSNLKGLKLTGILDYNTAVKFDNIPSIQNQMLPYLPANAVGGAFNYATDIFKYIYYKFIDSNNKEYIIADAWIIPSSIILVTNINIQVNVTNAQITDIPIIRDQLRALGYIFTISQI